MAIEFKLPPTSQRLKPFKPKIGKGDYGSTDFIGSAVGYKSSWQAEACGTVDELNAMVGESCNRIQNAFIKSVLLQISKELFILGTDIANTKMSAKDLPHIHSEHIHHLEDLIVHFEKTLAPLHNFLIPMGPPSFTSIHLARAICRRAERQLVKFMKGTKDEKKYNPLTLAYLNRLGDLFFTIGRVLLREANAPEICWSRKDT